MNNPDINYLIGLAEIEEEKEDTINIDKLLNISYIWLKGFNEEHSGDCTNQAFSCTKCYVERMLKINTSKIGTYGRFN